MLVIPTCMYLAMLDKLLEGHQGVVRCRSRAPFSVWWSGRVCGPYPVGNCRLVRSCTTCAVQRRNPSKPMIASETDLRPWQHVGIGMFVHRKAALYASGRLRQQLRRYSQVDRNDIFRLDSGPEVHLRKIWDPRDCVSPTTGRSVRQMSLRVMPVKAPYTAPAAHDTIRAMAKRNGPKKQCWRSQSIHMVPCWHTERHH